MSKQRKKISEPRPIRFAPDEWVALMTILREFYDDPPFGKRRLKEFFGDMKYFDAGKTAHLKINRSF